MIDIISDLLLSLSKRYLDEMVDETGDRLEVKADEMMDKFSERLNLATKKSIHMLKEIIPPIAYTTMFLGSGVIILVLGLSAYIDSLFPMVKGAGFMIGGVVLVIVGFYFRKQLDRSVDIIDSVM